LKLVVDVQYSDNSAIVAGIIFSSWNSNKVHRSLIKEVHGIEAYVPGSFYKRELPCIISLLNEIEEHITIIIIDGYVVLGSDKKAGLGMYLFEHLNKQVPIIGVAKKRFKNTPQDNEILRGKSLNPLFITVAGIELYKAKELISNMEGKYRIPTLINSVDQLCRGIS